MRNRVLPLCLSVLAMSACSGEKPPIVGQNTSSIALSSEDIQETKNVSYRGTLEAIGPSIYQQGTHMLSLGDGRMILLESTLVDFSPFIGTSVEVFGALRPTVEAGGIIMRVEQITSLSPGSASSLEVASALSRAQVSSAAPALAPASVAPASASAQQSVKSASSAVPAPAVQSDASLSLRIAKMAKEDISDARWTQLYCSSHVKFCVPVHKNWWYVSFGNNGDTLWHVEVNSEEFETPGSGIIAIDLIGGDIVSTGQTDGEVRVSGNTVTGWRSWTQGRHFAITADAKLEAAVRYMTEHVRVMQ